MRRKEISFWPTFLFFLFGGLFLFIFIENWTDFYIKGPLMLWWITALDFVILFIAIGLYKHNRVDGLLIDTSNRISLSHLQITLWTILVFSSLLAIGFPRIFESEKLGNKVDFKYYREMVNEDELSGTNNADRCFPGLTKELEKGRKKDGFTDPEFVEISETCVDPFAITLPMNLIVVLGISITSVGGTLIIKSNKMKMRPTLKKYMNKVVFFQEEIKLRKAKIDALESKSREEKKKIDDKVYKGDDERLAASALIDNNNREVRKLRSELQPFDTSLNEAEEQYEAAKQNTAQGDGILYKNSSVSMASWSDIFTYEEIENFQYIDIGKVQMFIITLVVWFIYSGTVYETIFMSPSVFWNPVGLTYPDFATSIVSLLALSHAGYIALRAPDQTPAEKEI